MSIHRESDVRRGLRFALALGALAISPALVSTASAGVHVGFSFNIALPPGVHVSVGNYEPYYVGRVFYQPLGVWRAVYSFPVETPYGLVYAPYVYDGGRVVCSDYIPGPELGYGRLIIDGRGHYDPLGHRGRSFDRHEGRYRLHDRAFHDRDRGWNPRRADGRDAGWYRGHEGGRRGDRGDRGVHPGRHGRDRGGSGGHHGNSHGH